MIIRDHTYYARVRAHLLKLEFVFVKDRGASTLSCKTDRLIFRACSSKIYNSKNYQATNKNHWSTASYRFPVDILWLMSSYPIYALRLCREDILLAEARALHSLSESIVVL